MLTLTYQPDEALDRALLVEFVAEIRASGARAIIVRYPVLPEIGRESEFTRLYRDACAQTGALCVDTSPAFDAASARGVALSAPGNHFNAAGHRIVAGALADALRQ
jgi:lysophospholipase L1-like esterase